MRIKLLAWNVEEFGTNKETWADIGLTCFISLLVKCLGANVLVIEEYRKKGRLDLPSLKKSLQNDTDLRHWDFDWLPGAIKLASENKQRDQIKYGDLDFAVRGNNEGYAVFWGRQHDKDEPPLQPIGGNKHSYGMNGDRKAPSFLNLVLAGKSPAFDPNGSPPIIPDTNAVGWTNAGFPGPKPQEVGTGVALRHRPAAQSTLRWANVRRPCRLRTNGANPADIIIYHAPADDLGSYYGALACGLARSVQEDKNHSNLIVAGDFNVTNEKRLAWAFYNLRKAGMKRGSKDPNGKAGYARTMIHYATKGDSPKLLKSDDRKIYGSPRDEIFYRLPNGTYYKSKCVDVLELLMDRPDSTLRKLIQGASGRPICSWITTGTELGKLPGLVGGNADVIKQLRSVFDFHNPQPFPSKLIAAIFYRLFISDHLPLFIEFEV